RRRHTRWPRDWSSDVCSSDLPGGDGGHGGGPPGRGAGGAVLGGGAVRARLALAAGPRRQPLVSLPPALPARAARRLGRRLRPPEIGRASCRERVCVSVVDVGV